MKKETKIGTTKCSKCGKKIPVEEVKVRTLYPNVNDDKSTKRDPLYVAQCDKCRHTIYGNSLEEMVR